MGVGCARPDRCRAGEGRTALLKILPNAKDPTAGDLVGALAALDPTDAERAEIHTALLKILPTAKGDGREASRTVYWTMTERGVENLVSALRLVSLLQSWLAWLKTAPV